MHVGWTPQFHHRFFYNIVFLASRTYKLGLYFTAEERDFSSPAPFFSFRKEDMSKLFFGKGGDCRMQWTCSRRGHGGGEC